MTTSDGRGPPGPSVEFLRLACDRAELAKHDLEKIWTLLIIATAIELGLVFDLGQSISSYFFDGAGHELVLHVIMPLVVFYLFMRLGLLLSHFKDTRQTYEHIARTYVENNGMTVEPKDLFATNSYFEVYVSDQSEFGYMVYSLFVPVVFACGQASAAYLIWHLTEANPSIKIFPIALYFTAIGFLYWHFLRSNRDNRFTKLWIYVSIALTIAGMAGLFSTR